MIYYLIVANVKALGGAKAVKSTAILLKILKPGFS